jgi:hypothetical protein
MVSVKKEISNKNCSNNYDLNLTYKKISNLIKKES